jgi:peptide/nickel transport system substrate-binding protein
VTVVLGLLSCDAEPDEVATTRTTLRIGTPNVVNSANIFADTYLSVFINVSHPPLMKVNSSGQLEGLTAESCTVSEDARIWTFIIRDDLYWSDGKKLMPEDVRFSVEYLGTHNPNMRWMRDALVTAAIEEGNAVSFTFDKPYTRLDLEFASYNIFPKHLWRQIEDPMRHSNTGVNVGFGPFFVERIDLDAGIIRFVRNPHWKGRRPKIDAYEIHVYRRPEVLSFALENGDVDTYLKYASSYPYTHVERLKKGERYAFDRRLNMGLVFLGLNLRKAPLSDRRFREALSYAIDYEEIIRLDAVGYGRVPNRGFIPPCMDGFLSTEPLMYDPTRAKRLLGEGGYNDTDGDGLIEDEGRNVKLTLLVQSDWNRVAELIEDYFGSIGIAVVTRSVDFNTWMAEKDKYAYDVTITRTTPWGMLSHANWATGYFDSRRSGQGVLHVLDDPLFLNLSDQILSTRNTKELSRLAHKLQRYYAEEIPAIALYWNEAVTPFNREFRGWAPDPLYGFYNIDTFLNLERTDP